MMNDAMTVSKEKLVMVFSLAQAAEEICAWEDAVLGYDRQAYKRVMTEHLGQEIKASDDDATVRPQAA